RPRGHVHRQRPDGRGRRPRLRLGPAHRQHRYGLPGLLPPDRRMRPGSCRHTDPATGVVAEVGTDGVPVGLALPDGLLDRAPQDVARAVLRTLTVAASDARDLLERLADDESADDGWGGGRHGTAEP